MMRAMNCRIDPLFSKGLVPVVAMALAGCAAAPHRIAPVAAPPTVQFSPPVVRATAQSQFVLKPGQTVVGELEVATATEEETLPDVARRFNLGYEEIIRANPQINPWRVKRGQEILLPTRFVLPDTPHEGVVIDVATMRLFYYPAHRDSEPSRVITYPIGIGKLGWKTPEGITKVTAKVKDPVWTPPASVRQEHLDDDDPLPARVPAGPDNPLGAYLFRLGWPSYLIHGTNKPYGIGMRASHGCVRLYPEDIQALFTQIPIGTPVRVVNQPYRIGFDGDRIEMMAVTPLEDDKRSWKSGPRQLLSMANRNPALKRLVNEQDKIDWAFASQLATDHRGIAQAVNLSLPHPQPMPTAAMKHVDNDIPLGSNWNGINDLSPDEKAFREMLMEHARRFGPQ
jgi:L,D-transpeptidase ErfK/SrfK